MFAMISTENLSKENYRFFLFLAFIGWERFDFHGKLPYIRFAIYFQSPLVFFYVICIIYLK